MNKLAFIFHLFLVLNPITLTSQNSGSIGIGFSYNSNDGYEVTDSPIPHVNVDFLGEKMLYGLDIGIGKMISDEQNYTGTISQYRYAEDVAGITYTQTIIAVRGGYRFNNNLILIGSVGASFFTQYQERFDDYYIFCYDGSYFVATGTETTKPYLRLGLGYVIDDFMIDLGVANSGFGFGVTWFFL